MRTSPFLKPSLLLLVAWSAVVGHLHADPEDSQPFLGVILGAPRQGGVAIDRVFPGTAADAAGMLPGDVVTRLGDRDIATGDAFQHAILVSGVGATVDVELLRDGRPMLLHAVLRPRPDDSELRREEADHVLQVLGARPGQVIADIGCGSGWLSRALAAVVGDRGRVYAVEIDADHVRALQANPTSNIVPVHSQPDDVSLPENILDIAMLHDVASHVAKRVQEAFYDSVRRALKPGGRLVIFGPHGDAAGMLRDLRGHGVIPVEPDLLDGLSAGELDERLENGIVFRMEPDADSPS